MKSSPLGFIKTKLSQFINDTGFFSKNTKKLINYLLKEETLSKASILDKLKNKLASGDYAKPEDIKTNTAGYINDVGFFDNTVSQLENFYTKEESMTSEEITNALKKVKNGIRVEIATTIKDVQAERVLYLIQSEGDTDDSYDEYMLINNKAELIGNTKIDLSEYAILDEIKSAGYAVLSELSDVAKTGSYNDLIDKPEIPTSLVDFTNANEIAKKADLNEIINKVSNQNVIRVENVTIPASSWIEDQSAPEFANGFKFKAQIQVDGITGADWKVYDFFTMESFNGTLGSIVETQDGYVSVWANANLTNEVTIDNMDIVCMLDDYSTTAPLLQ